MSAATPFAKAERIRVQALHADSVEVGGVALTSTATELNIVDGITAGHGLVVAAEVSFTEDGAGTYTGSVAVPAGATILDIIVNAVVLWAAGTSATLKVGDATDDDGYYTAVNLKATDLLAGETLSFAQSGGKAGAYNVGTNTHWSTRYLATARVISGIVTSVGAGTAGRTRMVVVYTQPATVATATKV